MAKNDSFTLIDRSCEAKGRKTYREGNSLVHEQVFVTGDEETCKQAMTPSRAGEKVEMTHAHTIDLLAREEKQVTTNGVIKKRVVKEEQYAGLGDDKPVGSSTYENKRRTEDIEDPQKPSALQVLKNFVDKIADQVKVHGSWLIILGIGVGIALACSIIALAK